MIAADAPVWSDEISIDIIFYEVAHDYENKSEQISYKSRPILKLVALRTTW